MKLSFITVTHRSAAVLPAAVESFRQAACAAGIQGEVVVVEQTEDANEVERVGACCPDILLARTNRGYAAGLNAGTAAASGDVLLLGNPDLVFREGSISALVRGLEHGWDVVGPQFTLGPFLLPPADVQTPRAELARRRAGAEPARRRRFLLHEVARWRRVWEAEEPVQVPTLSGALVAVRAETARRIGQWDESYFLYFEEMDWLRRAAVLGLRLAVVPRARVLHRWGHAAEPSGQSATFERSCRLFYQRAFGPRGGRVLDLMLAPVLAPARPLEAQLLPSGKRLWLASPSPLGFPAAGARLDRESISIALRALDADSARAHTWFLLDAESLEGEPTLWSWRQEEAPP